MNATRDKEFPLTIVVLLLYIIYLQWSNEVTLKEARMQVSDLMSAMTEHRETLDEVLQETKDTKDAAETVLASIE